MAIQITPEVMSNAPEHSILLHPLPRVDEITTDVDLDPRAKYFAQVVRCSVRMALLALVMGHTSDYRGIYATC
jgi:aspartate carbamoyltransferase catalytic subunit